VTEAHESAVYDLQHGRYQLGLRGQQQAQRDGQPNLANPYPLAQRHTRDDVVEQMGRRLGHAPGPARRAKPTVLAAERYKLVVAAVVAVAAAQAQEAVGQHGAA